MVKCILVISWHIMRFLQLTVHILRNREGSIIFLNSRTCNKPSPPNHPRTANRYTMAAVESDSAPTVSICVADLETYAKSKLDECIWCYYHNGAADEITRRENVEAFIS